MTEISKLSPISAPTKPRRLSQVYASSNYLREALSKFGDDVVKVKDSGHNFGISNDMNLSKDLVGIYPTDFDILTSQGQARFERIPSSEVGVDMGSSRWQKVLAAGLFSSKLSRSRENDRLRTTALEESDPRKTEPRRPPFWGVSQQAREAVSTLTLQILLHEAACFTSCVLLGCLVPQAIDGLSWIKLGKPVQEENSFYFKLYGAFATLLVVITCIGFLLRIDTTKGKNLLTIPMLLIPTVLLSASHYINHGWELERLECLNYNKMDTLSKSHVLLTQDCSLYNDNQKVHATVIVMRIFPVVSSLFIALYLFFSRDTFYLTRTFDKVRDM